MTSKHPAPSLQSLSDEDLLAELVRRRAALLSSGDMTTFELAAETAKAQVGDALIGQILAEQSKQEDGKPRHCPKCYGRSRVEVKKQMRTLQTLSGVQRYQRHYYRCSKCQHGFAPLDDALGIPSDGSLTVEVEKRIADFGVTDTFEEGAARFSLHYGWSISENLVRRVVERVGKVLESLPEPMLQKALKPASTTRAKLVTFSIDGSMYSTTEGWQETKLGVVLRDEHHVASTADVRGEVTQARYVAASDVETLKIRMREAVTLAGGDEAEQLASVNDGAQWIWTLIDELFPKAQQILDWPHFLQHVMDCGKALLGDDSPLLHQWRTTTTELALNGKTDELLLQIAALKGMDDVPEKPVTDLLRYLQNNKHRIDYQRFRKLGLPIGSGIIESAHKHVLQVRMKRAGQHWSPRGCDRMARLRAARKTGGPHFTTRMREARKVLVGL